MRGQHRGPALRGPGRSVATATVLGIIPGLGCLYAGKPAQAAGWFLSVAVAEALFGWLAFPAGGLTAFGVAVAVVLQAVALLIWGGSVIAGRQHVRRRQRF
jgi:hypothetical protein